MEKTEEINTRGIIPGGEKYLSKKYWDKKTKGDKTLSGKYWGREDWEKLPGGKRPLGKCRRKKYRLC